MAVSLPRYVSLSNPVSSTSTPRFIEMVHEEVVSQGLFIAKGNMVLSPFSKLELMDAGSGRVHIRSCYNNKYLAIRSETDHRIFALADEPVDDISSWSCTMFKVNRTSSSSSSSSPNSGVTVQHAHFQGRKVVAREPDQILMIDQDQSTGDDFVFSLHDISTLLALKLPQFVTFKAYESGRYGQIETPTRPNIRFYSRNFDNDDMVHEIMPVDAGYFLVRNFSNNKFWKGHNNLVYGNISADLSVDLANLPAVDQDCFFNIQRIGNPDFVAISRSTTGMYLIVEDDFYALVPRKSATINTLEARFEMEEAVKSRDIYNVRYNVGAARVLFGHPKDVQSQTMYNESLATQNFERTFTYEETTSTNWNATISASYSVSSTVTAKVPLVSSGSLTFGWEISGSYEWGSERTTSVTKEDKLLITALPMAVTVASRWESQSTYDVPFSYTQEDTLFNGQKVVTQKHDGLAIGINNSDIFYRVTQTPLDSTRSDEAQEYIIVPESSRIVSTTNNPSLAAPPPPAAAE